ncbi:MAG TPA: gamma-glutamylcyclotransferase family protein, partial [Candidatus Eisenbacteria bacterium]|nr:gamma-glutamylcyclotransferase family protein [Candidatus Eisenbacteria bacterium]
MRSKRPRPAIAGSRPALLFTYGTLMRDFRLHRFLDGRAEFFTRGQVRARVVDLGSYPGAVPDTSAALHGEVYRV